MARIQTYGLDTTINASDKVIGTDGAEGANYATKNFTVGDLRTFILEGVTGGGEANVQSDWNVTDTNSDAFILSKPTTITQVQADAITTNSAKTSFPGFGTTAGTALEGNTSFIEGTTATQTAITEIKTLTSNEYASETKSNNVMYVII